MQSQTRSSAAAAAALALMLSGGLVAGCGGDSGNPTGAFLGRWYQISPVAGAPSTGFTLACTDPNFDFLVPAPPAEPLFLVWPTLTFEHGVLTDLAETSGNCSPLNYNVKGNAATLPDPDPYIEESDPVLAKHPRCVIPFTVNAMQAFFVVLPQEGWNFTLLSEKSATGTQQAKLTGTAKGHVFVDDGSATGVESNPDCTVNGTDTYERLTQP